MIKASTLLFRRFYVRQRPTCRHHVVTTPPQSWFYTELPRNNSVATAKQLQFYTPRLSSSVAANTTERHNFPSSGSSSALSPTSSDDSSSNLPMKYIDFTAASKIEGEESHIATITLHPGETLRAESGSMIYMTEGVACKYCCSLHLNHQSNFKPHPLFAFLVYGGIRMLYRSGY